MMWYMVSSVTFCSIILANVGGTFLASTKETHDVDNHSAWSLLPLDVCGTTRYQSNTARIVGGKDAKIGQFPWIARLGIKSWLTEPTFTCGCTLISAVYVVTAGHCGTEHDMVRLGEHDASSIVDCDDSGACSRYQDIDIKKYIFNYFNEETYENDITLILLAKEAVFNEFVRPACLPKGAVLDYDLVDKRVKVAGWGYVNSTSQVVATVLQYVTIPIIKPEKCNKIYTHTLKENQCCAGYPQGKDSCNGDSGGPMTKSIKVNGVSRHYLVGIVSYGKADCGEGPAVYTLVSKFVKTILDHMEE